MKCPRCPTGEMTLGTKTSTFERGHALVVVRHVPAHVCDTCGEATFSTDVTDALLTMVNDAVRTGAEVLVREFEEDHGDTEEPARSRVGAQGR